MSKFSWERFKDGKIGVEVANEKECKEFLELCEENEINWISGKATSFMPDTPSSIRYAFDETLSWSDSNWCLKRGYKIVKWSEARKDILKQETIVIYKKGEETIALLKENGNTVSITKAICCPDDEFDFNVGAKLAFDRLMGAEPIKLANTGKGLIGRKIEIGTKFKVINVEPHRESCSKYVCLDEYIGKIGKFNYSFTFSGGFDATGDFEKEYINAIDKENRLLCWKYNEVEILD